MFARAEGESSSKLIINRATHGALDDIATRIVGCIKLSELDVEVACCLLERGGIGDEMNKTTCCVSSKQGALRTFQDFYAIDIEHCESLGLRNRDVTLIEVNRIRCLDDVIKVVLGDATNRELSVLTRQVT